MPLRYGLPSLIGRPHISRASRTILVIIRDYKYHSKYLYQSNPNLLGLCAALFVDLSWSGKTKGRTYWDYKCIQARQHGYTELIQYQGRSMWGRSG